MRHPINRRQCIAGLGGMAVAAPLVARAQPRLPVVGWLAMRPRLRTMEAEAFVDGLQDAGFVEGRNLIIEHRSADGRYDRLPALAAELVERRVDVLSTAGGGMPAAVAAKNSTSTTPVLFMIGSDPVELGLVNSFSRPGGNLTGVAYFNVEVAPKRLELLHKLVPKAKSVALLVQNGNAVEAAVQVREAEAAVKVLGLRLRVIEVATPADLDSAFATVAQERIDLVHIGVDGLFGNNRARLIVLAARYGVPTSYPWREFTVEGGLMNYGALIREQFHEVGTYAARILRGEKPAECLYSGPRALASSSTSTLHARSRSKCRRRCSPRPTR